LPTAPQYVFGLGKKALIRAVGYLLTEGSAYVDEQGFVVRRPHRAPTRSLIAGLGAPDVEANHMGLVRARR
jgi:hypothetical protein